MATIKSPVAGYTGVVVGVQFTDGVGEADSPAALAYFRRHGYSIEESASTPASKTAAKGQSGNEPTSADLKARAKELGLSTRGKKDEIAARIAEHEKQQDPPHDPPADPTGDANTPDPTSTAPAAGDGAGSVREV